MPKTTFSRFKTPPEINLKHLEPLNAEPTKTKRGCLPCQKDITYREMNKQKKIRQSSPLRQIETETNQTVRGAVFPDKKNMNIGTA